MPQSRSLWTWRLLETELPESRMFGLRKHKFPFLERLCRISREFSKVPKKRLIFLLKTSVHFILLLESIVALNIIYLVKRILIKIFLSYLDHMLLKI
jgi:hypothetical protein